MTNEPARINRIPVAREGWMFIIPAAAAAAIFAVLGWSFLSMIALILTLAIVGFFRDFERDIPKKAGIILAPADGKVVAIDEIEVEREGQCYLMRRVGIFLSVFNVHVQRAPLAGTVLWVRYKAGRFINAMNEKCSDENENNTIWMATQIGEVGVRQIAGLIARRIVCYVRPGQSLGAGQRVGMIRFGSRTDLFLPLTVSVKVHLGQHVKAGLDVVAEHSRMEQEK